MRCFPFMVYIYIYCYLSIRFSGNPPPQKVLPLYEGEDSIFGIFKIYIYEFKLKFLSYI